MNNKQWWLRIFQIIGLALALGASMSADAGLLGSSKSWKEEVLLHDGQKIVIERYFNLALPNFESHERKELDETVTFTLPGTTQNVSWKTDFDDFSSEPNDLSILLLDIVKGIPYIATRPAGCIGFNKWKRPNPPYIFFKYDGKEWKQINLETFPSELTKINLIVGSPPTELLKSFYTVEQVNEQNRDIRAEGYRTIIRTPFAIEENRCPNLVPVKGGGWQTPGGYGFNISTKPSHPNAEKKN